ncbi:acyl-CoA synthetase [Gordonia polyisoprenivorans]|uniref:acyl-CoA synthetase n=1 Tax=Gordonia polyisoprenivorans TaxID=84595 RepID=UPI001AD70DE7|nr:acyl-CoA synthetase [Gordonia polyisoprenivorans]QTI68976.1 acyl-CoA synthetase [Gordonia polyisoprenivorans]
MYPGTHALTTPDKPAIIVAETGELRTYSQLDGHSADLAAGLHDLGLRRGDVIAMLSDNAIECFEIYWAAMRSGLYVVAINRHLSPAEVAYIVDDSDARVLFASAGVGELAAAVAPLVDGIERRFAFGGDVEGYQSYDEFMAAAGPRLTEQPRGSDMLYSSGTTGRPKGIRPPLLPISIDQPGDPIVGLMSQAFGIGADDVYLSPAPIYHAAPLKWSGAVHSLGGTVVMMQKFDPQACLTAIEKYSITVAQLVPTMFVRLLQLDEATRLRYDTSSLRLAVHAAAPCPPEVKHAMIDWWGPIILEYYGATEGHGIYFVSTQEWLDKPGTVGKRGLGVAHICDDEGRELGVGEVGTVYFERESRPFEYHKDPEKTRAAEHPEHPNWTSVGDLGYLDEDGYLFLTDRKAFMIISGGVNIYPQEIENVLTLHPVIFDVAVIGVPHPEMGEEVKAVVQLKEGTQASPELEQELIDYVRERIAHYKAPRSVDFVDELPRTATGKLVKRLLTDKYATASAV